MKRQVQQTGVRKWSGDALIELQSQPLIALDAFFEQYGHAVVQGLAITPNGDSFNVSAGYVALSGTSAEGEQVFIIVPFAGAQGIALPAYLSLGYDVEEAVYADGKSKPVAYAYKAVLHATAPQGTPYFELTAQPMRFVDTLQNTTHRFVTDSQIVAWNAKETPEGAIAKANAAKQAAIDWATVELARKATIAAMQAGDTKAFEDAVVYADLVANEAKNAAIAASAPKVHTHDYIPFTKNIVDIHTWLDDTNLCKKIAMCNVSTLNHPPEQGGYYGDWYYCEGFKFEVDQGIVAMSVRTGAIYKKTKIDGGWSGWIEDYNNNGLVLGNNTDFKIKRHSGIYQVQCFSGGVNLPVSPFITGGVFFGTLKVEGGVFKTIILTGSSSNISNIFGEWVALFDGNSIGGWVERANSSNSGWV